MTGSIASVDLDAHRGLPCSLRPLRGGIGPVSWTGKASHCSRIGHRADRARPPPTAARRRTRAGWRRWCGRRRPAAPAPGRGATGSTRMRPALRRSRAAAPSCLGAGPTRRRQAFTGRSVRRARARRAAPPGRTRASAARARAAGTGTIRLGYSQQGRRRRGGHLRRHRPRPGRACRRTSAPCTPLVRAEPAWATGAHAALEGQALRRTGRQHGSGRAQRGQRGAPQPRQRSPASRRTAPRPPRPPARRTPCTPAGRRRRRARRGRGAWAPMLPAGGATGHARIATIDRCFARRLLRVDLRPRHRSWPWRSSARSTSPAGCGVRRTNGPRGAGGLAPGLVPGRPGPDPRGAGLACGQPGRPAPSSCTWRSTSCCSTSPRSSASSA